TGIMTGVSLIVAPVPGTTGGTTVEIVVAGSAPTPANGTSRLSNLSTRGRVDAANPLLVGFAVSGTTARPVLVRGIGPTLGVFGVGDALAATHLTILDRNGQTVVSTEGWDASSPVFGSVQTAGAQTGAF